MNEVSYFQSGAIYIYVYSRWFYYPDYVLIRDLKQNIGMLVDWLGPCQAFTLGRVQSYHLRPTLSSRRMVMGAPIDSVAARLPKKHM